MKQRLTSWISSGTDESISLNSRFLRGPACRPNILVATPPARARARWLDRSRRQSFRKLWCSLRMHTQRIILSYPFHFHFFVISPQLGLALWLPGRRERQWWDLTVNTIAVALEERAQVREGAFLKVDAVGSVPCHHLPAEGAVDTLTAGEKQQAQLWSVTRLLHESPTTNS